MNNETVTIWGDGNNIRDYIYIDDLCKAIELLCDYSGDRVVFNIGSGCGYSINNIVSIIRNILDKEIRVEYTPMRKNDIRHIYLDVKEAECELNFIPKIDIEEGVHKYIKWLR